MVKRWSARVARVPGVAVLQDLGREPIESHNVGEHLEKGGRGLRSRRGEDGVEARPPAVPQLVRRGAEPVRPRVRPVGAGA